MLFVDGRNLSGQLGNQILALNNLIQIAIVTNRKYMILNKNNIINNFCNYFDIIGESTTYENNKIKRYNSHDLFDRKNNKIILDINKINKNYNIQFISPFLGELFYSYTRTDPNSIFKIKKDKNILLPKNNVNIGIHIRYYPSNSEFSKFVNNEKIYEKYYIDSINLCLKIYKNCHFIIFGVINNNQFVNRENSVITKFSFYNNLILFLKKNNIKFSYCETITYPLKNYMNDFIQLCNCDIIISSFSTFSICAGFLGKKKKIIHCKKYIEYIIEKKDTFWLNLSKGGNEFYNIWKLV